MRFLLSGYIDSESRILFHRDIRERVRRLAPFLKLEDDPYVVLANGKIYWILDAYTTSAYYPYSESFLSAEFIEYKQREQQRLMSNRIQGKFNGVNYLRNSVKVVIDAYQGSVDFYIYDEKDVLIKVWDKIFPGLLKPGSDMPENLQKHVRYPADFLLVQALVYAKYHMSDPEVFYNQEDLWIRATEKYYNNVQPVEPYYIMWNPSESDSLEFILMLPFTPKNRQVMIGWIAGMCDGENYGRFLAYKFPKEKRVLGPQQVETKIDQDPELSGQLTLWDQRGSQVIRGNVLAIPIDNTIFYVEPIYLQAETAAYPELRLVCVMNNDELSYASTFEQALTGLIQGEESDVEMADDMTDLSFERLVSKANDAFNDYLQSAGNKDYEGISNALQNLEDALNQLSKTAQANK